MHYQTQVFSGRDPNHVPLTLLHSDQSSESLAINFKTNKCCGENIHHLILAILDATEMLTFCK